MKVLIKWDENQKGWWFYNISPIEWFFEVLHITNVYFSDKCGIFTTNPKVKNDLIDDFVKNKIRVIIGS